MICDQCKAKTATVHFEASINGEEIKRNLCAACATSAGVTLPNVDIGLSGLLGPSFKFSPASPAFSELLNALSHLTSKQTVSYSKSCPTCRWSLALFKKSGYLGCPACYEAFQKELKPVIEKIQGGMTHKGKAPPSLLKVKPKSAVQHLGELRQKLQTAIRDERFEEAARLRDQIKELEKKP